MKKLDLFILKSFFGPFLMTFFVTAFIFVMQFLWMYIDDLVGKGLSIWVILEFLGWGSATTLPYTMPLSTLLASIMTFGNFGEHNELLSMKAAGISLQRALYPLVYVAIVISISAFFVSNNLIPLAYNKIYTLQYDISKTKEEIKIPTGTFYNGIDGYSLRVDDRNKETGMMYGVMVYNHTSNKGNVSLAIADSGMIRSTADKKALLFTLYSGVSYEENTKLSYKDTVSEVNQVDFSMQEVVIPLENYSFQKSEKERYGSDIMARNLEQLRTDRDSIGAKYDKTITEHELNVNYSIALEKASQLDTAKNKGLSSRFDVDTLMACASHQSELSAVEGALKAVKKSIQTMQTYDREINQHTYYLRRIDLEYMRKFTLSFACLIFFFIGAPLGAIIRKGGLGTPMIVSSMFFVLYWVVDISGKKLAKDGAITPELGAFLSTMVLLPISVFLTWKSTKDSAIFNIDSYIQAIKKVFSKFIMLSKRKIKPKIVFMGTPEFAVESLKALIEGGYDVAAVVTVPDRKSGRGLKVSYSPVKKYLLSLGEDGEHSPIELLQPESLKDSGFKSRLEEINADIFVVVAFRMLPRAIWSMPRFGTFNLHSSLLPKYRGAAPMNWAIINGETESGVTTFLLDDKIDTGSIIMSESVSISEDETVGELYEQLQTIGARLVLKSVDALANGTAEPVAQSDIESVPEYARYAPKLTAETLRIDWNSTRRDVMNLVRGLSPVPAAHSNLVCDDNVMDVKIYSVAVPYDDSRTPTDLHCGEVAKDGRRLFVGCADGAIEILELQIPGKRRLSASDFLLGFRGEGARFE